MSELHATKKSYQASKQQRIAANSPKIQSLPPSISPQQQRVIQAMKEMGPMGLARSAGQVLFDLAISNIDDLVQSNERFGSLIYSKMVNKDQPTKFFFSVWENLYPVSMLRDNSVSFAASMARIATVFLLAEGDFNASKKDNDQI